MDFFQLYISNEIEFENIWVSVDIFFENCSGDCWYQNPAARQRFFRKSDYT